MYEDLSVASPPGGAAARVEGITRALVAVFAFGVPVDAMPLLGLSSVAPVLGGVLVVAATWQVVSTGRIRSTPVTLLLLAGFTAWGGASLLWAHDLPPARDRLTTYLQLLLSTWLLWQVVRDEREVRTILAGYVAGCCVVVAGAWQSFLAGATYLVQHYHDVDWEDEQRYAALGFDPNDMGVTLAIGIPMAAFLALHGKGRLRHLWFVYVPLAISGVALSGSRGATITTAIAITCVLWWIGRRSLPVLAVVLPVMLIAGAAVWLLVPESWERIMSVREQLSGGTFGERIPIWRAALDVLAHHPIRGVGVGSSRQAVSAGLGYAIVAHNTFISVGVEVGAIGAVLFFGAFAAVAYQVARSEAPHRALVWSLVLVWLVGVSTLSWEYRKTTWLLLLIGAAVARLPARERGGPPG